MSRRRQRGGRRRSGNARRATGLAGRASGRTPVLPLGAAPPQAPLGGTTGPADAEVEALQARARTLADRLRAIQARIGTVGHESAMVAVVDPDNCVGCGVCHDVCPTGAISVGQVARVDGAKCTGCGRCVAECPRGALTLQEV